MSKPKPCPAAPGPLEGYAARFDDLFTHVAQRRGFRDYLAGLLAPRDRNKTLTALAGAEPVAGAGHRAGQRLQVFLSESRGGPEKGKNRRLRLLAAEPATPPARGAGVRVGAALSPRRGPGASGRGAHPRVEAAGAVSGPGPEDPGDGRAGPRPFRAGHAETWYAAAAPRGGGGPDGARRLVAATAD